MSWKAGSPAHQSAVVPAARLLLTAANALPLELRRELVLHVPDVDLADGLLQWPGTRRLIQARLGPAALVIAERDAAELDEKLRELGMHCFTARDNALHDSRPYRQHDHDIS